MRPIMRNENQAVSQAADFLAVDQFRARRDVQRDIGAVSHQGQRQRLAGAFLDLLAQCAGVRRGLAVDRDAEVALAQACRLPFPTDRTPRHPRPGLLHRQGRFGDRPGTAPAESRGHRAAGPLCRGRGAHERRLSARR
ncbi:hypothetical protein G6F40_016024 [Rhizopus arrhizus]|nr:hypothetical protein G6F40_016024 [Rhizopus arrhizus]